MAQIIPTAKMTLDKVNTLILVEDLTDYSALNFGGGDTVGGYITSIVFNDGVSTQTVYANPVLSGTPDIDPSVSPLNTIPITLPLNSDGSLKKGTYAINYSIVVHVETPTDDYETGFFASWVYDYDFPEIQLQHQVKCDTSELASQDITNYGAYATDISRVHTIYPPPASGKTQLQSGLALIIYNGITTKTWTQEVVSTVTFTFTDAYGSKLEVIAELSGSNEIVVECNTDICIIMCCINKRFNQYTNCRNPAQAQRMYEDVVKPAEIKLLEFLMANFCGNTTLSASLLSELKVITGCDGDCGCGEDGDPVNIIPINPAQGIFFVVDSPDGSITVTSDTVGNTVTYHVEVSDALQTIINNLKPIAIISSDNSVTYTYNVIMGVGTYDLSVNLSGTSVNSNRYYGRLKISHNPLWATPGQPQYLLTADELQKTGIAFQTPTYGLGKTPPNTLLQVVQIGVSAFWATGVPAASKFDCQANIMKYNSAADDTILKSVECEIFNISLTADAFSIRLVDPSKSNAPLLFGDLDTTQDYYLQMSIHADDAIVLT